MKSKEPRNKWSVQTMERLFELHTPLDFKQQTFLAGKSVISIEKRFFKQNSRFFWTFAIEYETDKAVGTKDIELETDGQKGLFLALKECVMNWQQKKASRLICSLPITSLSKSPLNSQRPEKN